MTLYLLTAIVAFSLFGACLFWVWIWSSQAPRTKTRAKAAHLQAVGAAPAEARVR